MPRRSRRFDARFASPGAWCSSPARPAAARPTRSTRRWRRSTQPGVNIMTAEDPVEFNLPGINQVQVRENIGLTFAQRPAVVSAPGPEHHSRRRNPRRRDRRRSPSRRRSRATSCCRRCTPTTRRAASTVSSTWASSRSSSPTRSTSSAPSASSAASATGCKEPHEVSAATLIEAGFTPEEAETVVPQRGHGCDRCGGSGYKGRVGVFEVMEMTEGLRELIIANVPATEAAQAGDPRRHVDAAAKRLVEGAGRAHDARGSGARDDVRTAPWPPVVTIMNLPDLLKATLDLGGSDLHLSIGSPPQVRVDGHLKRLEQPVLTPDVLKTLCYSVLTDAQKKKFEENWELDLAFGLARRRPVPLQRLQSEGCGRRGLPSDSREDPAARGARPAAGARRAGRPSPRPRARDRPHRQRQVHDARGDDRSDQSVAAVAHPHHRGSDRVSAPAQDVAHQPARAARRYPDVLDWRCAPPFARTPTSCSSAKCATSRRWKPRSSWPRRAI